MRRFKLVMVPDGAKFRKLKQPRPKRERRDRFFSEAHPNAYRTIAGLVPVLPALLLFSWLSYSMLIEWGNGNRDFYLDWLQYIVPGAPLIGTNYELWLEVYGAATAANLLAIGILVALTYFVIWRWFFPEYRILYHTREVPDGRLYWSDLNTWTRLWDQYYGSPERRNIRHWVLQRGILNPINPRRSLTMVETTPGERFACRPFVAVCEERPHRRLIKRRHIVTCDGHISYIPPQNDYVRGQFRDRTNRLLGATTTLAKANPEVNIDALRDSSYPVPDDLWEVMADDR